MQPNNAQKPTILVIEDEPTQLAFLEEVLQDWDYGCVSGGSIADGRALFQKDLFTCALIDLGLPDGNGLSLISEFAKADPCMVPIVLTGARQPETVIDTMREGAFDYLVKPINAATLKAALTRALSHHTVIRERGELFELLLEEREQLRARVDEATEDIRQYASACERSSTRLQALLRLSRFASGYFSEEALLRGLFAELGEHIPLRAVVVCDITAERLVGTFRNAQEETEFIGTNGELDLEETGMLLLEAEPETLLQTWLARNTDMGETALRPFVFSQQQQSTMRYIVGFYTDAGFGNLQGDREFLDTCARFLVFEWEQAKLLLHVAHHASLGNIGVEVARNFIQPLTAIRTAADLVQETVISPEAAEGLAIIQQNVERLHRQTQEFRKLSLLREGSVETVRLDEFIDRALDVLAVAIQNRRVSIHRLFETDSECILLNGTTLARTFLDLILDALRMVDTGAEISLALRQAGSEYIAFEMSYETTDSHPLQTLAVFASPLSGRDMGNPGLQLAERTVHSCGGTLSLELHEGHEVRLRIVLPRNVTLLARRREVLR
ncbi:MAG TPA: response regulator [Candidatus Hydrogenedentes bacterium]|nr:response regulator [Candidatus Hydrogenedentota bacterium]HQH53540.1 response regulator [Candidatus Hydrogenedentota bacterium]